MKTLALLGVLAWSTPALADDFGAKANGAVRVGTEDLVWAMTAPCDDAGRDDVQQRQCRIARDRKAKAIVGVPLIVEGDASALELGTWSAAKKSVTLTLTACVRCGGVDVGGKRWFVIGAGAARLDGDKLRATTLYDSARQFPDEASATAWIRGAAKAKFEMVVRIPDPARRRVSISGKEAIALEILAWRVINPCDGAIVISSVPSAPAEPDRKACSSSGGVVIPTDAEADALTPAMVSTAMQPVVAASRACFTKYRMAGKTKLEITILADGTVEKFEQKGDFDGSPTATCIDDAMSKISFPKTKKPRTKIGFPVTLE